MAAKNKKIKPGHIYFELAEKLRAFAPLPGSQWDQFLTVEMLAGDAIGVHKHAYHTVLYYPEEAEPITVHPTPGTMLYLPIGTNHSVAVTKKPRISVAMLIETIKKSPPL